MTTKCICDFLNRESDEKSIEYAEKHISLLKTMLQDRIFDYSYFQKVLDSIKKQLVYDPHYNQTTLPVPIIIGCECGFVPSQTKDAIGFYQSRIYHLRQKQKQIQKDPYQKILEIRARKQQRIDEAKKLEDEKKEKEKKRIQIAQKRITDRTNRNIAFENKFKETWQEYLNYCFHYRKQKPESFSAYGMREYIRETHKIHNDLLQMQKFGEIKNRPNPCKFFWLQKKINGPDQLRFSIHSEDPVN